MNADNGLKRGKGGRPRSEVKKPALQRTSIKWTDFRMPMANYVRDNYEAYKSAGNKMNFIRELRATLKIPCDDDRKLKSAFADFLKKYTDVKAKLNSSGFGIDPEKDSTLDRGWIQKQCPYFDILDEVMGTRPNVVPPAIVATSSMAFKVPSPALAVEEQLLEENGGADGNGSDTNAEPSDNAESQQKEDQSERDAQKIEAFVKDAFRGLKPQKLKSKDPIGAYSEIMGERMKTMADIENKKMEAERLRHDEDIDVQRKRNEIEIQRINSQVEIEREKLQLEKEKLADKAAERDHELLKLKLQHEFELKKLQFTERPL